MIAVQVEELEKEVAQLKSGSEALSNGVAEVEGEVDVEQSRVLGLSHELAVAKAAAAAAEERAEKMSNALTELEAVTEAALAERDAAVSATERAVEQLNSVQAAFTSVSVPVRVRV